MIWAETGWATTGEKKKEGALGVASPWALARTVEREEADRAGGSGLGLGSWGPRRCGQRAPGSERLLCSLPSGHGGGGEGSPRGCAKAGRTPGGTGLAGDGCRRPSLGRIWLEGGPTERDGDSGGVPWQHRGLATAGGGETPRGDGEAAQRRGARATTDLGSGEATAFRRGDADDGRRRVDGELGIEGLLPSIQIESGRRGALGPDPARGGPRMGRPGPGRRWEARGTRGGRGLEEASVGATWRRPVGRGDASGGGAAIGGAPRCEWGVHRR